MTELSRSIAVTPIIKYPCEAQVGKTYLMTIDLQPEEEFEWQYEEEEYPIYCTVNSELFNCKPIGEPVVVLHRFGGGYGGAKFLLTALRELEASNIEIALINRWGVLVKSLYVKSSTVLATSERPSHLEIENKYSLSKFPPNPYKGLGAFQETDGDLFFGRENQVVNLRSRLRYLFEAESVIRLLPIFGPSGSGKSSLVRAGLIPELAKHPMPGCDRSRVAILTPGSYPLESLAVVLARICTNNPTPVAKTREFLEVLVRKNPIDEYDGLNRIANAVLGITISPLIVLVDQFEEIYTLCHDQHERDAFVANLLYAAADRAKSVMVIVILRSDFLGETLKHPALNRLLSEQGYLVPAMNSEELQRAIAKPAEFAGHPLDAATIDLLVKDTEGRAGALPLLQFTLTRVWEKLTEGKHPSETLREMGGIAGCLDGEAQRIYDSLSPTKQEIARRIFLGLVQVGEGTMNSRRRTEIQNLISYRDDLEQVRIVINQFAAPAARLITCSSDSTGGETVEITHEALIQYWQQLNHWLQESTADIRFQRRVEDAATWWNQNGRPDGSLWRSPDLELLEAYYERAGANMTKLTLEFLKASRQLKRKWRWRWWPF